MKKLMTLLVILGLPQLASAGMPMPQLWNCMQIGFLNQTPALIVSDIQNSNKNSGKHYKTREKAFAEAVKKQWKLKGAYEPLCQDFHSKKEADEYYKFIVKKANDKGLKVYPMKFKWQVK